MRTPSLDRRSFLKAAGSLPLAAAGLLPANPAAGPGPAGRARVRLSCNLFSFNDPLRSGEMTLDEVLAYCADLGFDAVDPTAYYFPNYPDLPDDAYVYRIKRKAFRLGLDISGTGIRNDFTRPDPAHREADVELARRWVGFAARLGAPVLRVFAGQGVPDGHTRDEVNGWVAEALRACVAAGAAHGVMIVLQNHADFIQTADQLLHLLRLVDSEWLAVNLDTGSCRVGDPYEEIARLAPFAATWQVKEHVFIDGKEVETDLSRIVRIVDEAGYRGYLPIETLGPGDPRVKVPLLLDKLRAALAARA